MHKARQYLLPSRDRGSARQRSRRLPCTSVCVPPSPRTTSCSACSIADSLDRIHPFSYSARFITCCSQVSNMTSGATTPRSGADPLPRRAGRVAAFTDFCVEHETALRSVISVEARADRTWSTEPSPCSTCSGRRPADARAGDLIDVGTSAGTHLAFDRTRYEIGGRTFGDPASSVRLTSEWRSARPVPNPTSSLAWSARTGIDLNPFDSGDAQQRLWLRALVWPEDHTKAEASPRHWR